MSVKYIFDFIFIRPSRINRKACDLETLLAKRTGPPFPIQLCGQLWFEIFVAQFELGGGAPYG